MCDENAKTASNKLEDPGYPVDLPGQYAAQGVHGIGRAQAPRPRRSTYEQILHDLENDRRKALEALEALSRGIQLLKDNPHLADSINLMEKVGLLQIRSVPLY